MEGRFCSENWWMIAPKKAQIYIQDPLNIFCVICLPLRNVFCFLFQSLYRQTLFFIGSCWYCFRKEEITCPITCQMSRYESVIDVFAICQALLLQFFDIYKKQQKQTWQMCNKNMFEILKFFALKNSLLISIKSIHTFFRICPI